MRTTSRSGPATRAFRRGGAVLPALFVLLGAAGAQTPASQPAASHVVIISVDGFRPDMYLPGPSRVVRTPAIDALRARGSWAEGVVGVYPSLTYPSHTSIATGMLPVHHGIVQNTKFDPSTGSTAWYFESSALKAAPLWDAAARAGLRTAGVSWPVTVGARMDWLYPESNQAPRDSTWLDLARRESTPGLVDAVVARLGGFEPDANRDYKQRDRFAAAAASLIIEEHRPNLLMVHLVEADTAQHEHGPNSTEAIAAMARVDAHIGEIVQSAERAGIASRTAFIVTGDHGFYRVHSALQPNVVLRDAGLLRVDATGRIVDWRAAAHRAAIRLKDPSDAALAREVEALFQRLADSRYKGIFRVIRREEIAQLGGDPDALLILEPTEGYTTTAGLAGGFLIGSRRGGDHGYLPTEPAMRTGLVAAGAGIRAGLVIPLARQIDIAPTAARLLGFDLHDTDGVPMVGMLGTSVAATR